MAVGASVAGASVLIVLAVLAAHLARRRRWTWWPVLLIPAVALGLLTLVLGVPKLVFPSLTDADFRARSFTDPERQAAQKDRNALQVSLGVAMLQMVGGVAVAVGAVIAWRQLTQTADSSRAQATLNREQLDETARSSRAHAELTKQELAQTAQFATDQAELDRVRLQIDRMTNAVSNLADKNDLIVRMGSVFTLGSIAESSVTDRPVVAEVLTAYVRLRSGLTHPDPPLLTALDENDLRELRHYRPDVQAAMSVLGRHTYTWYKAPRLRFRYVDLRRLSLENAHFERAAFTEAHLEMSWLIDCWFQGASFRGAHFQRSTLVNCDFFGCNIRETNFASVTGLESCTFEKALYDSSTRWPPGFPSPSWGAQEIAEASPPSGGTTRGVIRE